MWLLCSWVFITCHYDDSNEKIGKNEVAKKEECDGKELTATEAMRA